MALQDVCRLLWDSTVLLSYLFRVGIKYSERVYSNIDLDDSLQRLSNETGFAELQQAESNFYKEDISKIRDSFVGILKLLGLWKWEKIHTNDFEMLY